MFFINDAYAEGAATAQSGFAGVVPLVVLGALFYFLLLRPQIKRSKEHKNMLEALSKGDEVVTTGGIVGKLTKLDEAFLTMEIAENMEIKVQKSAVTSLVPKGTLKSK